jgi:hypothetical protein
VVAGAVMTGVNRMSRATTFGAERDIGQGDLLGARRRPSLPAERLA